MDRLSGLDASFLYLETPEQLLHVCGLLVLQPDSVPGGYDFSALRDRIARRVAAVPEFRRKLRRVPLGLDHPVWVEDTHFDVERHVHRVALPAPGDEQQLAELCGHLAGLPLDRNRPLWEMWVVEGLADGRVAVLAKIHHATVDGMSGMTLLAHLCSLGPDVDDVAAVHPAAELPPAPSEAGLVVRGLLANLRKPLRLARIVPPTVGAVTGTVGRARAGEAMAPPFKAPRTSFNGTISGRRVVAFVELALDDVKDVKNATGTTVNDVVLAVCGGALRRYLQARGELPDQSLLATVPVSVRRSSEAPGANQVSAFFARLGTDLADPLERLQEVARGNRVAKGHHQTIPASALQEWAEFATPRTLGMAMRVYSYLADHSPVVHNLVISNVPGPPVPVYFMGALIEGMYALGPIFHGAGLNITVLSHQDKVHVGLIACRELMPDLGDLAGAFAPAVEEMRRAALGAVRTG